MWLVTPVYKPCKGHLEGEQPYLRDLLTMVINHLLTGTILQVRIQSLRPFKISDPLMNQSASWKGLKRIPGSSRLSDLFKGVLFVTFSGVKSRNRNHLGDHQKITDGRSWLVSIPWICLLLGDFLRGSIPWPSSPLKPSRNPLLT